jgi:hypothetical protein
MKELISVTLAKNYTGASLTSLISSLIVGQTMTRIIIAPLVGLVLLTSVEDGYAYDAKGGTYIGAPSCSEYLDGYSKTELNDDGYKGPHEAWRNFGFINGALTVYNANTDNGINNIIEGMELNDVRRWIASWCRDNQQNDLVDAISDFIMSRKPK